MILLLVLGATWVVRLSKKRGFKGTNAVNSAGSQEIIKFSVIKDRFDNENFTSTPMFHDRLRSLRSL